MRIKIKDLRPNPFRDMKNYPINPEKIKSLTNSINQTGFWDNILARKSNGKFEIAYGHHRLVVLKKLFKPDDYVDIPIRELDNPTMIRVMANENINAWGINVTIINETIKVVKQYLEKKHAITKKLPWVQGSPGFEAFEGLPLPKSKPRESHWSVVAWQISDWLGKNWSEYRVWNALENLGLFGKELDKEAVESLPSEDAAVKFKRATKQIKNVTLKQQKRAAKRIVKTGDLSESGIKSVLLDEKYKYKKAKKEQWEKHVIELKNLMVKGTKNMKGLNDLFLALLDLQTRYNINFEEFEDSEEAKEFKSEMFILIDYLKKFSKKGGEKSDDKILQIDS